MPNHSLPEISTAQRWVHVLAAAYELEPEEVIRDAMLAASWQGSEHELRAVLCDRHAWDPSIPRYYVPALYSRLRSRT